LSKRFIDKKSGTHISEKKAPFFVGTAGFASLNSHTLIE